MPRYNLAYSPADENFAQSCIAFATTHFAADAEGYCLSASGAFPHVTLCQFETEESRLGDLWDKALKLCAESHPIAFDFPDLRPGGGANAGFVMAELVAYREPELIGFQQKLARMLVSQEIAPLTHSGDRYHPHLTFARLSRVPRAGMPLWPDKTTLRKPHTFRLTLGLSDDNGVYFPSLGS